MIILASAQILLRNLTGAGFAWADEALRLMVLWVAMLGAVAASREYRQISIDVLSRYLPERSKAWVAALVDLFTSCVAAVLTWYSFQFVSDSYEYQDVLLGDQPAWIFQSILPLAFALMTYRYAIWFVIRVKRIVRPEGMIE
jgi:TRAP-type C4-dicarboxylate transport system permease small subunit